MQAKESQSLAPRTVLSATALVCLLVIVILTMLGFLPERHRVSAQDKSQTALAIWEPGQQMDEDDAVDFPTINESVPSCLAFVNAESQLWNIWTIENNGDKSIENAQRDEIATKDFLRWYRYRGHRELLESGERCAVGMRMKYGRLQGWRARTYVAEAQQRQADFFVREMANECGEENLFPDEAQERAISHSLPRATPLMIPPGYRVPLFSVY